MNNVRNINSSRLNVPRWDLPSNISFNHFFKSIQKGASSLYLVYTENPDFQVKAIRLFQIPIFDTAPSQDRHIGAHYLEVYFVPETKDNRECFYYKVKNAQNGNSRQISQNMVSSRNAAYVLKKFLMSVSTEIPSSYLFKSKKFSNVKIPEEQEATFLEIKEMSSSDAQQAFNELSKEQKEMWHDFNDKLKYGAALDSVENYTVFHAGNSPSDAKYKYVLSDEEQSTIESKVRQLFKLPLSVIKNYNFSFEEANDLERSLSNGVKTVSDNSVNQESAQAYAVADVPF